MHIDPQHMAVPTIHLNGTGPSSLQTEYAAVRIAAMNAISALEKATCNSRDFYLGTYAVWEQAVAERAMAFRLLQQVVDYAAMWEEKAAESLREREANAYTA